MLRVLTILAGAVALAIAAARIRGQRRHLEHAAGGRFPAYNPADAARRPDSVSQLHVAHPRRLDPERTPRGARCSPGCRSAACTSCLRGRASVARRASRPARSSGRRTLRARAAGPAAASRPASGSLMPVARSDSHGPQACQIPRRVRCGSPTGLCLGGQARVRTAHSD
jgi:hypothetical protein